MNLPHKLTIVQRKRRRGCSSWNQINFHILLLLGLWISNAIIGCVAMPHPKPQTATSPSLYNSISKDNDEYEENFAVALGAPLILPQREEIILDKDSEYTLSCESDEEIIWKYPNDAAVTEETPYQPAEAKRQFGIRLTVRSVNNGYVGNYYCIKARHVDAEKITFMEDSELTDLVNNNMASSIYIYVNDTENLLVPIALPVAHVIQFQDVVIPCKPSMPNTTVILRTPDNKNIYSDSGVRYFSSLGFVIEIRDFTESGLYMCLPKHPSPTNDEESTEIEIILAHTTHVDKPVITSNAKYHASEGDSFSLLCELKIAHDVRFEANWTIPESSDGDKQRIIKGNVESVQSTQTHSYFHYTLTVKNAQKTDSGAYTCHVVDHGGNKAKSSYLMLIVRKGDTYAQVKEVNDHYSVMEKANKTVTLSVQYRGYPHPTIKWYKPDGGEILPMQHHLYNLTTTDKTSSLKIINPRLLDGGVYMVNASNGINFDLKNFTVIISDLPIIKLDDVFIQEGDAARVQCRVQSWPKATITWYFVPCSLKPRWPNCDRRIKIQSFNETSTHKGDLYREFIYDLTFYPKTPGKIYCDANNFMGTSKSSSHIIIRDIDEDMVIQGPRLEDMIAIGDDLTITCAAVAYYFSDDLQWFKNNKVIQPSDDVVIASNQTSYSYQRTLTFKNIQDFHQGEYECRVGYINNHEKFETKKIDITTHEPNSPRMTNTNLGSNLKIERKIGDPLELICQSHAIPRATVTWYKDDEQIESNETSVLYIPSIKPNDQGYYKCVVANRLGVIEETVTLKITDMPKTGIAMGWILAILLVLLILIGLVIYLCIRVRRERKLLRELKAAGLANFEEGAVEHINPALTLDEQADLLPYNREFEFPREKLKLGKQLGAGAFGVVLKAHAEGIRPEEKESVVAVKMVKRNANNEVMRALVSELKIMVHMGQHVNVVNLLGAVTKNIAKRELMVIVEFCRYGNVQNFLLRNRKRFINQINPTTGKIDPSIMTQRFSDNFELNRDGLKYVNLTFANHQYINHMNNINNMNNNYSINNRRNSDNDPRSGTRAGRPGSAGYITQSELYEGAVNTCGTEQTVMTTVPEDEDNNIMSNNSVQPAWRSNYKPDSTEAMSVTTTDLISWAFQVACGMEYLSSRKVLHGDLAARNILLCEDNIVKICDFGLARSMYKSDNYKKQGEAPLPIKWLALESLSDHVFSTYTDVWSYGIVLWEFFSLAKVPYPGMDPNQSLYVKLKDGYRMEKPPYANDELYDVMLECWSKNPESRPLFHRLKEKFAVMLGDDVTTHYMDLNEPYLRANFEYMKHNPTDYLTQMSAPDEMAPAPPPFYVNGQNIPQIHTAAEQHSPTLANNMDSPVSKSSRSRKEGMEPLPEEIPMLPSANSDSPEQPRKFAQIFQQSKGTPTPSPRHNINETQLMSENENYVNVKTPPKHVLNNNGSKAPEAFSNPSYLMLKTVNEQNDDSK